jgi:hypothetical protein
MPAVDADTPRKMFPPPMTSATSTPISLTSDDLSPDVLQDAGVDGLAIAGEGLARQLEEDAPVFRRRSGGVGVHRGGT